jgi:hypothetical protein
LLLLWNSNNTHSTDWLQLSKAFDRFACYQNRLINLIVSLGLPRRSQSSASWWNHAMMVMKPKVCSFVHASALAGSLYRGLKGFWKHPYGRPEGPNCYACKRSWARTWHHDKQGVHLYELLQRWISVSDQRYSLC